MDPNLKPVDQTVEKLIEAVDEATDLSNGEEEEEEVVIEEYRISKTSEEMVYDLNYSEEHEEEESNLSDEEGEASEAVGHGEVDDSEFDYLTNPEELVDRPTDNLQENIVRLREKVESIELATSQLFSVIDYFAKDKDVILKLNELDPFPLTNKKGALRQMIWALDTRICALEKEQERAGMEANEEADVPELTRKTKKRMTSDTILDTLLEPKSTNPVLQSVYGNKTNGDVVHIIRNDLSSMTERINGWHETNVNVTETLKQLKGRIPSEALCACVSQVALMKRAINIMTGGRYSSGEDIIFLNPNRVGELETRLSDTGERLKTVEEVVKQMGDFDKQMKKLRKKFAPYIRSILYDEPLPGETEQQDIGLDELNMRIQVIMEDMKTITTISDQLLKSQLERDNRLANIRMEIERLRAVKADKEDVEDVLQEKASPSESNMRIYGDDFFTLLKRIAEFNNKCAMDLAEKEGVWRRTISEIRNESETKANVIDLEDAKKRFQEEVDYMIGKLKQIQKKFTPRPEVDKQLDNVICISCGAEIKERPTARVRGKSAAAPFSRPGLAKPRDRVASPPIITKCGKRLTKRFAGSSHTITTPEQRLDRPVRADCEDCRHPSIKETCEMTAKIEGEDDLRPQKPEDTKSDKTKGPVPQHPGPPTKGQNEAEKSKTPKNKNVIQKK